MRASTHPTVWWWIAVLALVCGCSSVKAPEARPKPWDLSGPFRKAAAKTPAPPVEDISGKRRDRSEAAARRFEQNRDFAEYQAAMFSRQQGDDAACADGLRKLLKRNPDHREARLLMAEVLMEQKKTDEAIQHIEHLVEKYPLDAEVQHAMAMALDSQGKDAAALAYYERAAVLAPGNEMYRASHDSAAANAGPSPRPSRDGHAGDQGQGDGPSDLVTPSFDNPVTAAFPGSPAAQRAAARRAAAQRATAQHLAADAPGSRPPSSAEQASEPPAQARDAMRLPVPPLPVVANRPEGTATDLAAPPEPPSLDDPPAAERTDPVRRLPVIGGESRSAGRAECSDRAGAADGADGAVPASHAEPADKSGPAENADPDLGHSRQSPAGRPDDPQAAIAAATTALRANQTDAAIRLAAQSVERFPKSAALHRILAAAYYRRGDYAASQVAAQQALSLDKSSALSYFLVGSALARLGQSEAADAHWRQAARLDARYGRPR